MCFTPKKCIWVLSSTAFKFLWIFEPSETEMKPRSWILSYWQIECSLVDTKSFKLLNKFKWLRRIKSKNPISIMQWPKWWIETSTEMLNGVF